ncbi:MAG: hypothetical protein GKR90_19840 [Pseudomonadales bacterium]|nr:hypothetical protein [Pseudomonadales bacterium]
MTQFLTTLVVTVLYWIWESQAEGNIRIDLLLLYPILIVLYTSIWWSKLKWKALIITAGAMLLNVGFFLVSYDLFGKHPG